MNFFKCCKSSQEVERTNRRIPRNRSPEETRRLLSFPHYANKNMFQTHAQKVAENKGINMTDAANKFYFDKLDHLADKHQLSYKAVRDIVTLAQTTSAANFCINQPLGGIRKKETQLSQLSDDDTPNFKDKKLHNIFSDSMIKFDDQ